LLLPPQVFGLRVGRRSADHPTQVCNASQQTPRMLSKRPRTIASGLNPSFSPKDSLTKPKTRLFRFGHPQASAVRSRTSAYTPALAIWEAARALHLLIRGFVVVNGLCVTTTARLDLWHRRSVSRAEKISGFWISNQASSKNGPPTIGPGTRGISVFWQLGHSSTLSVVSVTSPMFRIIFL
jgi:hypothetical protein